MNPRIARRALGAGLGAAAYAAPTLRTVRLPSVPAAYAFSPLGMPTSIRLIAGVQAETWPNGTAALAVVRDQLDRGVGGWPVRFTAGPGMRIAARGGVYVTTLEVATELPTGFAWATLSPAPGGPPPPVEGSIDAEITLPDGSVLRAATATVRWV